MGRKDKPSRMKPATLGLTRVEYGKRSHFRAAKSFASPPQLVRTGWGTCSRSCSNFQMVCVSCLKHARRAKTMANCFIVHRARHAKRVRGFDQRSVRIPERSVVRSEIGAPRAERCQTLPVGSKASFPFRSSTSEVRVKRPIDARTLGHQCSTDAKSFASLQHVWKGW